MVSAERQPFLRPASISRASVTGWLRQPSLALKHKQIKKHPAKGVFFYLGWLDTEGSNLFNNKFCAYSAGLAIN